MNKNTNKMIAIITIFIMCIFTMVGCKEDSSNSTESTVATTNTTVETEVDANVTDISSDDTTNATTSTFTTTEFEGETNASEENTTTSVTTEEVAITTESTTENTVVTTETTTEAITETTTECVHDWIPTYTTVHHNAVTEEVEVTKEVPIEKEMSVARCKACGWTEVPPNLSTGTYAEHVEAMGTKIIILWGEEWEVPVCGDGSQAVGVKYTVYETQTVTETRVISEAYDEKVLKGYICSICGSSK